MEMLQEKIKEFSDEYLLNQYFHHCEEYQPEALGLLKKELEERKIDLTTFSSAMNSINHKETKTYDSSDFLEFDHSFSSIDILLAASILRDNDVVFYIDHVSDSSFTVERKATELFGIKVHADFVKKTHELLDEHFEKKDGRYLLKISSPKERLKAFSFYDLHLSEEEDRPFITVTLSSEEISAIDKYGKRLIDEVDTIESEMDRVVFFYDSIGDVLDLLKKSNTVSIHKSQLLAILEVLQVYCDDPEFPSLLDETISNILSFFIEG